MQMVIAAMKLKDAYSLDEKLYQPRQHIKKKKKNRDIILQQKSI